MNETGSARLDALEDRMDAWEARFDNAVSSLSAQISHARDELHVELSALRTELTDAMRAGDDALCTDMRAGNDALRTELTDTIARGNAESRRYMRVLYEDLVERIARIGEGGASR